MIVPLPRQVASIKSVPGAFLPARLSVKTKVVPLANSVRC